jgi:hypothetical protein
MDSLELESHFDGNKQEYLTPAANQFGGDSGSESSAMTAGNASDSTSIKKGSSKTASKGLLASTGMGKSGVSGAGSGAGLGSALLGSGNDQADKKGGVGENGSPGSDEKSKTGGYSSSGGHAGTSSGSSDGSAGIPVTSDLKNEYSLDANGDGTGNGKDGLAGSGSGDDDGSQKGTAEDPEDYFKRIDKSASIFKIVSARYMKKKTLWIQQPPKKI